MSRLALCMSATWLVVRAQLCTSDADCLGYCQNAQCWDGSEGDSCARDSDCQSLLTSLVCRGFVGLFGKCQPSLKKEGEICGADSDCLGYCELLTCYDGSNGDACSKNSDCQSELTCHGIPPGASCRPGKKEGQVCGADSDCLGYCEKLV
ncbi:hypothetical protein DIPPA_57784, partial [Diplonema papillatum]